MTTYYLNGNPITEGSDITLNGFTYPYSWLEGTSASVRASLGIEKVGDVNYDPKYYWGVDIPKILEDREETDLDGNPLFVKILGEVDGEPAMVDSDKRLVSKGLKSTCTAEVKFKTNELLKPTDFYIIRAEVEGSSIPDSVVQYRSGVISTSDAAVTAISSVDTVEQLIGVMDSITWPETE